MGTDRMKIPMDQLRAAEGRGGDVSDLVESMAAVGQLHPVLVVPDGDGYLVVAGRRRLRAARFLRWEELEATEVDPELAEAAALYENIARRPLPVADEGRAVVRLGELHRGAPARKPQAGEHLSLTPEEALVVRDLLAKEQEWAELMSGVESALWEKVKDVSGDADLPTDHE